MSKIEEIGEKFSHPFFQVQASFYANRDGSNQRALFTSTMMNPSCLKKIQDSSFDSNGGDRWTKWVSKKSLKGDNSLPDVLF